MYLRLLMVQWSTGTVPKHPRKLRDSIGVSLAFYNRNWPRVSTKFIEFEGTLINRRLEEHRSKALEIQRRNIERATTAAKSRWDAPSNSHAMLQAHATSTLRLHAIQSNPDKNKIKRPVSNGDNSQELQRAPLPLMGRRATAQAPQPEASADKAWVLLIASDGAIRPARAQAALDRIPGGWPAIRMRTPRTEDTLRAQFTAAYDDVKG